ncbi:unnamed protein product [Thlaspi arvense]|uniref:NYN domain-containing protein n=1 Tax=Thlaspi arvense TaxID=13288 RepID=A0AAU9SEH9_THLAR|nr:unnamed protein product [Thlaspi arvense]
MSENCPAAPEHATAKIAVWWDMKGCPVPEGYDSCRVRPNMEAAFKELGYSGPVSITAYGDIKQAPEHLLRGLSSTGVAVSHYIPEGICSLMYSDMLEWRARNPPPATMMLISDKSGSGIHYLSPKAHLFFRTSRARLFFRTSRAHLKLVPCFIANRAVSIAKAWREAANYSYEELDPVTRTWGKNYPAKPEYATAQIVVWWDMLSCPIPEGYDARQVRPSIEAALKQLGYSGPVSITAYGDQSQVPEHLLRGLSSTGVALAHTISEVHGRRMLSDLMTWPTDNPPPATMMVISDQPGFANNLADLQQEQETKYNIVMAYSYRPYKMPVLVTGAEWLWESLLAVAGAGAETRRHVLRKCSERGETTGMFSCKVCFRDCKSLGDFTKHLSSDKHAERVSYILETRLDNDFHREYWRTIEVVKKTEKMKRLRKAFGTGFGHLHNHLRRLNARKSQTCKKEW